MRLMADVAKRFAQMWRRARGGLRLSEECLTLFPLLLVSVVWITMAFGGCLTGAHWWGCLGVAVLWAGCRRGYTRLERVQAVGWMLLFLAGLWVWAGIYIGGGAITSAAYHEPGIRLLVAGWNPLRESTPEALEAAMGAPAWAYRPWHLLFVPKSVWVFNAAAYGFTRTPFNPQFPLFLFLSTSCLAELWRLLRSLSPWVRMAILAALWWEAPGAEVCVDSVVYFGGILLLSAMARTLRGEQGTLRSLVVGSFWMVAAKQPGMLACGVFWVLFLPWVWRVRGGRALREVLLCGFAVAGLSALACASPYWTAWRDYGHPLYPAFSTDSERFPPYDITADFRVANEDARAMGHIGNFCNAYLSPRLVQAYYCWRLGRERFEPMRETWKQTSGEAPRLPYPLPDYDRWLLLAAWVWLFCIGRREERFVALAILCALFCYPATHMGYARYQPWYVLVRYLAVARGIAWVGARWPRGARWGERIVGGVWLARWGLSAGVWFLAVVDRTYALQEALLQAPPEAIYSCIWSGELARSYTENKWSPEALAVFGHPGEVAMLNLWFVRREISPLSRCRLVIIDPPSAERAYPIIPCTLLRVAQAAYGEERSYFSRNQQISNRAQRLCNYPGIAVRVLFGRLPKLIAGRLSRGGLAARCVRAPLTEAERSVERLGPRLEGAR